MKWGLGLEVGKGPGLWTWHSPYPLPPSRPAPPPFPGKGTCPKSLVMSINRNSFLGCCSTLKPGPSVSPTQPSASPKDTPEMATSFPPGHGCVHCLFCPLVRLLTPTTSLQSPTNVCPLWLASQEQPRFGDLRWSTRIDEEFGVYWLWDQGVRG